jgi:hypothetical protein
MWRSIKWLDLVLMTIGPISEFGSLSGYYFAILQAQRQHELHLFASSQLGLPGLSKSTSVGIIEPLLPVFRSHKICINKPKYLMSMEYLVHDFYSMCKNLKRHSRTVFVDMGASLDFHGGHDSPAVYIQNI